MAQTMQGTSFGINAGQLNADGTVDVYDIDDKRWKRKHKVDATEALANGSCNLSGPLIKMDNGKGVIEVAQNEIDQYVEKGYKVVDETVIPTKLPKADPKNPLRTTGDGSKIDHSGEGGNANTGTNTANEGGGAENDGPVEFGTLDLNILRDYGKQARIKNAQNMNKGDLIAALNEAKFVPTKG